MSLAEFLKDKQDGMPKRAAIDLYGEELGEDTIDEYYEDKSPKMGMEIKFDDEGRKELVRTVSQGMADIYKKIEKNLSEIVVPDEFNLAKPNWYIPPFKKVFVENLDDIRFPRSFAIENLEEIRIPEFPREITIKKPDWYKEQRVDFNQLINGIRKENVDLYDGIVRVFDEFLRGEKGKVASRVEVVNFPPQVVQGGGGADFKVLSDIREAVKSSTSNGDGIQTVTTAGTRVQLSSTSIPCKRVFVQANSANTGVIAVGGITVVAAEATRRGLALFPTQGDWFNVSDVSYLYIDSTVNGEKVNYYYE